MDQVKIYSSRKKSLWILTLALIMLAGSLWMLVSPEDFENRNPVYLRIVGAAGALFCGLGIFVTVSQLIKNRLLLVVDGEGINVDPNRAAAVKIAWEHIEGFSEISVHGTKIIVIHVDNPDHWIERERSAARRKMMKFNLGYCGSPFGIGVGAARISHTELWNLLNEKLEISRGNRS